MGRIRSLLALSPLKISAAYFLFGVFWIPLTDVLLAILFASQQMPTAIGILKGWIFIGLSALLIFTLSLVHQRQLTTARTRLETTNQQLQVLHRVFRHNIRNDVTAIRGYAEMASERVSEAEIQDQLAIVQRTANRIIGISEKLKIVERVDPALSNEEVVDLVDLLDSELANLRSSYPAVTIETDVPDRVWIHGGPSLKYAIREILENAILHTDGPVTTCEISVRITDEGEAVALEISDNGPGIPPEELEALQTEEETPLIHASSVGLWLATWLCRLHGGSIAFCTDDGTTAVFRFRSDLQHQLIGVESPI